MRVILALAIVTSCVLMAGCRSEQPDASAEPSDVTRPASGDSTNLSARFVDRTVFEDRNGQFAMTVRGAFDWSERTGWAVEEGAVRRELVQVGDRCFERLPPGVWQESAANDVEGLCDAALFTNPASEFELVSLVGDDLVRVGRTRVRGIVTTHYRARLAIGGVKGPIEFWVDDDGLVRRSRQGGAEEGFVGVRDYFDFGMEVVVRPPPDKHTKLMDLIRIAG